MRRASTLLVVLLPGCSGAAPVVLKGDDSFVTVSQPDHTRKAAATDVARSYCLARGKRAVFLSDACPQASCAQRAVTYWCH